MANSRRPLRLFVLLSLIFTFVFTLFVHVDEADARRRRRRRMKQPKVINETKLYERMGGKDAIAKTVDEWIRLALADTFLSARMKDLAEKPTEMARSRRYLNDELCELADGPCAEPSESEWVKVRTRLGFDETQAVSFASLLSDAMIARGIGERERNEMLGRLGSVEPFVVSEATGPAFERRGGSR